MVNLLDCDALATCHSERRQVKLALEHLPAIRIQVPSDVRRAAEALRDAVVSAIDCRIGASHNIATGRPMVDADGNTLATDVFGWRDDESESWWRMPRFAFESPLPTVCRYESEPFWCNSEGIYATRPNPFLKGVDLTGFEQRSLLSAAIVAPVHLPFGQIGAVSIAPRDRTCTDLSQEFELYGVVFGLFARTFIAGYVAVMTPSQRLPSRPQLRKREVECLRWAALGKSDEEIGTLLSITRSTVRFHITNAMVKLDAVNRTQATLKATQLGYIKST